MNIMIGFNFLKTSRRTLSRVAILISLFSGPMIQQAQAEDPEADCMSGNAQSCNDVAWQLMKEDKTISARRYFGKGCDLNLAKACNNMAWILRKQNERKESLKYYARACALDHKTACTQQRVLENRLGVKAESAKPITQQEQTNHPKINPGEKSIANKDCSKDGDNIDCQSLACSKGNAQACMQLGDMASRSGKLTSARKFFQQACDYGASLACVHAERIPDIPGVLSKSDEANLISNCTAKNAATCIEAAEIEREAGNMDLALTLYEKSCSNRIVYGCVTAARLHYEQGDRVLAKAMIQKLCSFTDADTCEPIRKTACQFDYGWGC